MVFSSAQFIFVFLPLALLGMSFIKYFGLKQFLIPYFIILSVVFYIDWNYVDIIFVAASVITNYLIACRSRFRPTTKIVLGVALNAGYLLLLKIFVSQGAGSGADTELHLFGALGLPLGISFITFQQIAFVVDEAEHRDHETSFMRYLFFVMFFPQLVSGPIVKHRFIIPQTVRKCFQGYSAKFLIVGIIYFGLGVGKKVLIADKLDEYNTLFFSQMSDISVLGAWVNMFLYSFKIYFDFSAYADMAVGLGYMVGIQLPRNFFSPYKSTNISQFWRIWHISLHRFFKEYVYLRMLRLSRDTRWIIFSIFTVMILSSVWHGVGLGYLVWGTGHALGVIGYRFARTRINFSWPDKIGGPVPLLWRWCARGLLFVYVSILWVPFATNDVHSSITYLGRLFAFRQFRVADLPFTDLTHLVYVGVAAIIVFALPNSHQIALGNRNKVWPIALAVIIFAAALPYIVARTGQPIPFVYFQF